MDMFKDAIKEAELSITKLGLTDEMLVEICFMPKFVYDKIIALCKRILLEESHKHLRTFEEYVKLTPKEKFEIQITFACLCEMELGFPCKKAFNLKIMSVKNDMTIPQLPIMNN